MDDRDSMFSDARFEHRSPTRLWGLFCRTSPSFQRKRKFNLVDRRYRWRCFVMFDAVVVDHGDVVTAVVIVFVAII